MKRLLGALVCSLALAACGGGGSGSAAPPAPAATDTANVPLPQATLAAKIDTQPGEVNGAPAAFSPAEGDTTRGGSGSPVDGMTCDTVMYNTYHVHAFLGIIVNGSWLAVPTAIGMIDPGQAQAGFVDSANCFYWIHTHDSSGYIHMESPNYQAPTTSEFTLGNVMDVWGQTLSMTQFASWSGMVRIFTAQAPAGSLTASNYTEYDSSTPNSIPLYSHEAVWIEVNPPYTDASQLPPVTFYTQY